MSRPPRKGPLYLASVSLDEASSIPLHRQLYFALREAILDGRLRPGARLPSSRSLASDLRVSRNTVLASFEQLLAEGYIEGRIGAGSFVSELLPEHALNARPGHVDSLPQVVQPPGPSKRGTYLTSMVTGTSRPRAFAPGLPELAAFPFEDWARLLQRHWRNPPESFLIGSDPAGYGPLREALARYLGASRAVRCRAEQVFIVSGAQQALDLAARVLLDPGDEVWVEDPGYPGLIGALLASGSQLVPLTVDQEGLSVTEGRHLSPRARMACISPSHQYPLGVTMTLARRLELLEWAREADAFVLEDDYDSEYRYTGRPLAALQGLDTDGRVIYVGTMSKVMFPGLRLGYMVVPEHLVASFKAVRRLTDTHPSTLAQPALAEFIEEGSLAAHVRRTRSLYAERQQMLLDALGQMPDGLIAAHPSEAGMHLVASLAAGIDDRKLAVAARRHGVEAPPLSSYYRAHHPRQGLLLGYAGVPEKLIERGVAGLARALSS
ncbi:MAG: PLP-dependent aminotransferase family protein [Geminicoccaceae bacterium]|nr:PLP-dependent aminotransferase family protein [Geminicoccaceae bacterium]MCB9942561.1 PLP-dependent aminotransferase family protein [Geminicoccaceae bacterium]